MNEPKNNPVKYVISVKTGYEYLCSVMEREAGPYNEAFYIIPEELKKYLFILGENKRRVLEIRYGLLDGVGKTLKHTANLMGLTPERIRQMEASAIQTLRWRIEDISKSTRK